MHVRRKRSLGRRLLHLLLLLAVLAGGVYAYRNVPEVRRAGTQAVAFLEERLEDLKNLLPGGHSQSDDWRLVLVNFETPIDGDFSVETAESADGYLFDARAVDALDQMLSDGRAAGMQLVLTSAYRTEAYQSGLFEDKVARVMGESGCTREEAEEAAAMEVARPGTSEHQTGLAADIVCAYRGILDAAYADTAEAVWLREHCAEYGFILRYPPEKSALTGVIYEPWHFRYVGTEAAKYIMDNGLCLEEYLDGKMETETTA